MNMFKSVKAKTVEEYLDSLPADRREILDFLDGLIRKTAPSLKRHFAYNMPGYGSFRYRNYKNEMIDWPVISIASQKNYVSLYVCAVIDGKYLAETNAAGLGKVSVGKSCIRFKKISDLNIEGIKKVIRLAEKSPGLAGVGAH